MNSCIKMKMKKMMKEMMKKAKKEKEKAKILLLLLKKNKICLQLILQKINAKRKKEKSFARQVLNQCCAQKKTICAVLMTVKI